MINKDDILYGKDDIKRMRTKLKWIENDNFVKGIKHNKYSELNSNINNELNLFINSLNNSKKLDKDIILLNETKINSINKSRKKEKEITKKIIIKLCIYRKRKLKMWIFQRLWKLIIY